MKLVYKPHFYRFILLLSIVGTAVHVDAQQLKIVTPKDNFTTFSPERTYADLSKLTILTPVNYRNNPDFGKRVNDNVQWYEQIGKRTFKTRTFIGPVNEIITENAYDNINYVDENGWMRAVDTKLKPYLNGWAALQQEMPVYLYPDASTALSIGNKQLMVFNKNVQFNHVGISAANYTVGDNGMYIKNATPNTDKIIRFGRGSIETDYTIKQPIKLNGDLVISEDVVLPSGYIIVQDTNVEVDGNPKVTLMVLGPDGKEVAELKAPFCYDNRHESSITGLYNIQKEFGGYKLEIQVPSSWLNDPSRQYPVTIDPLVTGKTSAWTGGKIPSCLYPNFGSGTIVDTVPADITVTSVLLQGSYYCPVISKKYGEVDFITDCGSSGWLTVPDTTKLPGIAYGLLNTGDPYACCIIPSCSTQTYPVTMEVSRDSGGTTCDSTQYVWYDPSEFYNGGYNFESYVVGRTVQDSTLTFTPTSLCANQCTVTMNLLVDFGVPPYTVTHPWSTDTVTFGKHLECLGSKGTASLTLHIPNCPGPNCTPSTLDIPPPHIVDACGDTVAGVAFETIGINAVPNVTATPVDKTICSGTNVDMALGSCEPGATFTWTGPDGSSGSGDTINSEANNNTTSPITADYTVTATGGGCTGNPFVFEDTITPFTISISPANATICDGNSVNLSTSGEATSYSWSSTDPSFRLSCNSCSNPVATPTVTTTYSVKGTNGGSCSAFDTIVIVVNPIPTLNVSPSDTTIIVGQSAHLYASSTGSVTWSPSTGLSSTSGDSIIATPIVTTTYTASVTLNSCTITEIVIVKVNASLYVPSAFTPNSGDQNSVLRVLPNLTTGLTLQEFRVYNRWGEEVFETTDISAGWDGKYNGKAEPMGTYVYYVEFLKQGQTQSIVIKGDVTLIR